MANTPIQKRAYQNPDKPIRFLVADNDHEVCAMLRNIPRLESKTWRVETTRNGRVALQSVCNAFFEIAILDISLPNFSGLDILQAVQQKCIQTDIVLLTEKHGIKPAVSAMKAGARDILTKPVDKNDLISTVYELLKRRRRPTHTLVNRLDAFLKDHLSNPSLRRSDLCRHFHISPSHVSKVFHDGLGTSFRERLCYYRIERAKQMLKSSGDSLYIIAEQCVFRNQSRFAEAFRRQQD